MAQGQLKDAEWSSSGAATAVPRLTPPLPPTNAGQAGIPPSRPLSPTPSWFSLCSCRPCPADGVRTIKMACLTRRCQDARRVLLPPDAPFQARPLLQLPARPLGSHGPRGTRLAASRRPKRGGGRPRRRGRRPRSAGAGAAATFRAVQSARRRARGADSEREALVTGHGEGAACA